MKPRVRKRPKDVMTIPWNSKRMGYIKKGFVRKYPGRMIGFLQRKSKNREGSEECFFKMIK